VTVRLTDTDGVTLAESVTDDDGRVGDFGPDRLEPGVYQVVFGSGDYFAARRVESFHPEVVVRFTVAADQGHYHIPLLLSPYAYTTYRGS
ncbi:MAG: hydroxyisourate hydrolase, partial [Lapillicoccus sp.]